MKTYDVQSVLIEKPFAEVYDFVSDPTNLPKWANAFKAADQNAAELVTPAGTVKIKLRTDAQRSAGTVDSHMTFPDGGEGVAYTRVTPDGADRSIYTFVLMAPPVALEQLEGALNEQIDILAKELIKLKGILEG